MGGSAHVVQQWHRDCGVRLKPQNCDAGSKKAAESHRGGTYGRAGGSAVLLSDDEEEGRPGYGALGRGSTAYGSSNSLRSQDRASDGGHGGPASTSGFSGFEDATEGMGLVLLRDYENQAMVLLVAPVAYIQNFADGTV